MSAAVANAARNLKASSKRLAEMFARHSMADKKCLHIGLPKGIAK
jgi:hypothetical protein